MTSASRNYAAYLASWKMPSVLVVSRCRRFRDGGHLLASHGERPRDTLASHAEFIRLPGRRFM